MSRILLILNERLGASVKDWDTMEKLWEHAFKDRLRIVPEEHPMLLAVGRHFSLLSALLFHGNTPFRGVEKAVE